MQLHRNARLGLRGRLEGVLVIDRGMSLRAPAAALSVSPATADRWWQRLAGRGRGGAPLACLSVRPFLAAASLPAAAGGERAGADLRGRAPLGLAAAADRGRDRPCARDGLAGA